MDIPPPEHEKWIDAVSGKIKKDFEFFPLKLLLARLNLEMLTKPSPATTEKSVKELRALFVKNKNHPKVKKDLKRIFGRKKLFGLI